MQCSDIVSILQQPVGELIEPLVLFESVVFRKSAARSLVALLPREQRSRYQLVSKVISWPTFRPSKYRPFIFNKQACAAVGSLNLIVMTPSGSLCEVVRELGDEALTS